MNVQPPHAAEAAPADSHAAPFGQVYSEEWEEIQERRAQQLYPKTDPASRRGAPPDNLVGLALSGGGIRSATFCLGLLQGLHKLNLLRAFDYLSTVSGGGYVGGWWSAWLSRDQINSQIYQLGQDEEDFALLCEDDIKNPVGLIIKLRDGADEFSVGLRERLPEEERRLLESYDEHGSCEEETEELQEILVKELNVAISERFFSGLRYGGVPLPEAEEESTPRAAGQRRFAEHSMWANRLLLEEAYPCEFKDIFPPREQIEMERFPAYVKPKEAPEPEVPGEPPSGLAQESERGVESSMNAWRDPIHHLRLYANYLTPRKGLLSYDTWRAVSVVTRNLTMTWLVLLPILTAVMLLGQLFFALDLLDLNIFRDFLGHEPLTPQVFWARLGLIALPFAAILGLIGVLCIAWLLCLNDRTSVSDMPLQAVCLLAVMLIAGSVVFEGYIENSEAGRSLWNALGPGMRWAVLAWLAAAGAMFGYAMFWPVKVGEVPGDDPFIKRQWEREVRRGKISRIHTKLLVWLAVVTAVLLLAGFGHELFDYLFYRKPSDNKGSSSLRPASLIPLLGAVGGSIFTALKAAPTADDKGQRREPSFVTRFVFAVTPSLVVVVLAVSVTWCAHEVLGQILEVQPGRDGKPMWVNKLSDLPRVCTVSGILLCFALAVYEMKWGEIRPSWTLLFFVGLLATSLSWAVTGLGPHVLEGDRWALVIVAAVLLVTLMMVYQRVSLLKTWQQLAYSVAPSPDASARGSVRLGFLSLLVSLLLIGVGVGVAPDSHAGSAYADFFMLILPVAATCVTGSLIMFRMMVERRADETRSFELRVLRDKLANMPQPLVLVGLVCALVPFAAACWIHLALMSSLGDLDGTDRLGLTALPLLLAALAGCGVAFRLVAARVAFRDEARNPETYAGPLQVARAFLDRHFSRYGVSARLNGFFARHRRKVQLFTASSSVLLAVQAGLGLRKWAGERLVLPALGLHGQPDGGSVQLLGFALTDSPVSAGVVLLLSLILLWMSVGGSEQIEGAPPVAAASERRWLRRHSRAAAWLLALCCVSLALLIGFLATSGLSHINQPHLPASALAVGGLLPSGPAVDGGGIMPSAPLVRGGVIAGMVACLILAVFEMKWGAGDNRRSMWLLAGAYVTLSVLLVASYVPERTYQTFEILRSVFGLIAAVMVWVVALGWMVDPNSVSMHHFYKGRLVRAYLGASNIKRRKQQKEIAESAADDDLYLSGMKNCQRGAPYHLVNATLNLVAGRDLATAQRSASSFVLSKRFCGSLRTRYRPTFAYMKGRLSLGTAIATSGAAVSPNMGSKKPTSALAMLLTLLNVRLGYWAPTPNREHWQSSQPRLWPFYLLREFLSQTNDLSSYCYLTDGGHFDNTGLYSLVERGCRNVVMVDCGADPLPSCFQDLGDAIRRCRIDFGTEIKLNLAPFIETSASRAGQYFAVGGIRYSRKHAKALGWPLHPDEDSKEDKEARTGTLIYFKPSIVGRETADVRQYAIENKHFPQQTTANQWFDEAQFESYRRLGQLCAKQAFGRLKSVEQFNRSPRPTPAMIEEIFRDAKVKFTLPADLAPDCG